MNRTIRSIEPVRQSAYRRFPVIFTLLTTVGAVATFLGIEKLLQQYEILGNYPWLMLCFGLSVLVLTGTLYKKLG